MDKYILAVPRKDIPETWLGHSVATPLAYEPFRHVLERVPFEWVPRSQAERDSSYKQLIPYVLLQNTDGSLLGAYRRAGSEKRLHDLWSLGIGGHAEPVTEGLSNTLAQILEANMHRELTEEVAYLPPARGPFFCGIINEEQTEVGTVHLGLVHRVIVTEPEALQPGAELEDFRWVSRSEFKNSPLELWSKLALSVIDQITDRSG